MTVVIYEFNLAQPKILTNFVSMYSSRSVRKSFRSQVSELSVVDILGYLLSRDSLGVSAQAISLNVAKLDIYQMISLINS